MAKKKRGGKKKVLTKTCGNCFGDLKKDQYDSVEWKKKSMDCICKKCKVQLKNQASSKKDEEKKDEKKIEKKEEGVKFKMCELPKQYQPNPKIELDEKQKKYVELRKKQTPDLTVKVNDIFNKDFPLGEIQEYSQDYRTKNFGTKQAFEDKKDEEEDYDKKMNDLREVSEVHRELRKWVMQVAQPGVDLLDLVEGMENRVARIWGCNNPKQGFAFPIGTSLNSIAAHMTPNPKEHVVLGKDDVLKIDIGLHKNGNIIDSAFTLSWNPVYDNLLKSVREATNTGIKEAGIDVRLCDIGAAIQEVMQSYEVELNGKVFPVKTIENLSGHSLDSYNIHSGTTIPAVKGASQEKLKEGQQIAIETFGSINGKGRIFDTGECSHYMTKKNIDINRAINSIRLDGAKKLMKKIQKTHKTLAFCPRWTDKLLGKSSRPYLRSLTKQGLIEEYRPLADNSGSYVAQYEHTVMLLPTKKVVLSRGEDF